jgi:hypothetical protein
MSKDKHSDESLHTLGLDSLEPEQAVEKLRNLRAAREIGDAQIATAAGHIRTQSAAELLAEIESGASGGLRREVRRAIFRLRQHGIEYATPVSPPAPGTAPAPEAGLSALISPVDPEGAELVWLLKARPQGGLSRLYALTSEREGLVGANLTHISRRELRKERHDIEQRTSIELIDADYHLADFIMCDAYRHTPDERRGQVGEFLAIRAEILASSPQADYRHPIYDEFAAQLGDDPSVELLKEPEFDGWILSAEDLRPYLDEISEIRQSPLILNQYQQEERVNTVVGRAVEELFSAERGRLMRRRLEDIGYYLSRTGRTNAARWAAAAAAKIRDGVALGRVPFFVQYVMRSVGVELSQQQTKTEREPHLIMTPAEAMRAQAARARRLRR